MTAFIDLAEKSTRDEIRKSDWNALADDTAHLYESGLYASGDNDQVSGNYPIGSYSKVYSISFTLARAAHIIFNMHSVSNHSNSANNVKQFGYFTLDGVRVSPGDGFIFHHTGNSLGSFSLSEFIPDVPAGLHVLEMFGQSTVDNDVTKVNHDFGTRVSAPHWDIMEIAI